jgi:folate-binding Fe-S cluster repair protein YgfZ
MVASSISWNKGCYIGQEVISRLDSYDKVARMLMGVRAPGASGIAPGDRIELEGKKIGKVTSWLADVSMGLAIVERDACKPGSCEVVGADGCHIGELVDCAFWG